MPGRRYVAGETAAQFGAQRGGLRLGTTAPSARSALGRALRYLIPYRAFSGSTTQRPPRTVIGFLL
jgi:hypothetical protein